MHLSTRSGKDDVAFYLWHAARLKCAKVETSAKPYGPLRRLSACAQLALFALDNLQVQQRM